MPSLRPIAAAALLAVAIPGCEKSGSNQDSPPSASEESVPPPTIAPDTAPAPAAVAEAIAARRELDRTLFAPEVEAGVHEAVFTKLWDSMRNLDPFTVLADFPVKQLILGNLEPADSPDWGVAGIKISALGTTERRIDNAQFRELVSKLSRSGWHIAQSEWHHSRFEPSTASSPARSTVSFEIDALLNNQDQRIIARGDLAVTWERDGDGNPRPAEIDARGIQLIGRKGKPMFAEWGVFDPKEIQPPRFPRTNPILVRDLDDDGRPEVVAAGCNVVFQNEGGFRFTKRDFLDHPIIRPAEAGLLADLTGDGALDYVGGNSADGALLLFVGTGDGRFPNPPIRLPIPPLKGLHALSAGDIDGDGDLDLFAGQWKAPYAHGHMPTPFYNANDGHPDYLLRNNGSGEFTDITAQSGLAEKRARRTYSASLIDLDTDGDLDLAVVADFSGLDLYLNDGAGRFTDSTQKLVSQRHAFGMSHTFGDWDGDGTEDLYMVGMSSTTARRLDRLGLTRPGFERHAEMREPMSYGNRLYLRGPGGRLTQPAFATTAARTGWAWGCASADFDLDGDTDIYVSNGHLSGDSARDYCTKFWCHDLYTGNSNPNPVFDSLFKSEVGTGFGYDYSWNGYEHNVLLLNRPGKGFLSAGFLLDSAFEYDSRAAVAADLDLDGRPDLLVAEYRAETKSQRLRFYRNHDNATRNWIGVRLSNSPNHSPIGAVVSMNVGERRWVKTITTGDGFTSQSPTMAHFGLGKLEQVEKLEVRWPSGKITTMEAPRIGRYHHISESAGQKSADD